MLKTKWLIQVILYSFFVLIGLIFLLTSVVLIQTTDESIVALGYLLAVAGMIISLIGLKTTYGFARSLLTRLAALKNGKDGHATIVSIVPRKYGRAPMCTWTFEFQSSGKVHTLIDRYLPLPASEDHKPGKSVKIKYLTENPQTFVFMEES